MKLCPFFTYFKEKYPDFKKWFYNDKVQNRECWVHYEKDNEIGALLILKIEDEKIESIPQLPKKKRLKICTFKVKSVGNRIGELFIKYAVKFAINEGVSEIYLTHFTEENDRLVELISEYGFRKVATRKGERDDEGIFVKEFFTTNKEDNLSPLEIAKRYYPCFDDRDHVKKFIIPIRPEFHDRLFTDHLSRQMKLQDFENEFIVEGNTIKKAYLCHSNSRKIGCGDVILFYRSHDSKTITAVGVVESVHFGLTDPEKIHEIVRKRTVYKKEEIRKLAEKETTVIRFMHQIYLEKKIDMNYLNSIGIHAPMSITEINNEIYKKIKEHGDIDERFTVN